MRLPFPPEFPASLNRLLAFGRRRRGARINAIREAKAAKLIRVQREISTVMGNPMAVMSRIAERAVELTSADRAIVGMLEGDDLVVNAMSGTTDLQIGDRVAAGAGFLADCIRLNAPVPCNVEMASFTTAERPASDVLNGGVAVPVTAHSEVTGLLVARPRQGAPLTPEDILTLQFLAEMLSTAIQHNRSAVENQALVRERTRALERLQQSERRFRSLIENATDAIVIVDRNGYVTYASPAYERLSGFSHDQVLNRGLELVHPHDLEKAQRVLGEVVSTPGKRVQMEVRAQRADGAYVLLECVGTNLLDDPAVGGIVVNMRDVTSERRVQEGRAYFASLVESSNDAIVGWDLDWRILSWNPGAEKLFGYTAEEITGKSVATICGPGEVERNREVLERLKAGEEVPRYDTVRIRRDGRRIVVSLNVSPIYDSHGQMIGAAAISRDVTEQRKLEAELRQAQKMEAVGRLAGGIAHDFNNILTTISANAELALDELPLTSPVREDLSEIRKAGKRAAALTRQRLAFSRKQVLQPQVVNLNAIVSAVETMLRRVIGEDITLHTSLRENLGSVKVDPGQIEQVLMNLAVNSRDAMPEGGTLDITTDNVLIRSPRPGLHDEIEPGKYVTIRVVDTGTGMDQMTMARIFEPFFTTKEPGRGTGLGLSTVYGIVKQSGGYIDVVSRPGEGTSFTILLPCVEEKSRRPQYDSGEHAEIVGGTETILLAEDEDSVRTPLRRALQKVGYTVLEARDGREALREASVPGATIDLLLTDVIMPRMGGRELANRVRELHPQAKIFFMSGYSDDAIDTQGEMDVAASFIGKPFAMHVLIRRLREVLDGAKKAAR